jgi:hypothetical protein
MREDRESRTVLQAWVDKDFAAEFKLTARRAGLNYVDAMRSALLMWARNAQLADLSASIALGRQADELRSARDEERTGVPA